ncbi:MAG: hypothetical protein Q9195_009619 [Heterodermia aff. obscurata]
MEVAGLVLGAVALYSICIQCYEIASRANSKDHDFAVLHQRLGMQKNRFEACGRALHLDERQPCECCPIISKKEDAEIAKTIKMIYEHFEEGVKIEVRHASNKRPIPGRWVMKDREQFERVVNELERLVIDLEMASDRVKYKPLRAMKRRTRHLFGLGIGKRSDQMSETGSARTQGLEAYRRVKDISRG